MMTPTLSCLRPFRCWLPATALILGSPFFATALRAQPVEAAIADANGVTIKVMLQDLDEKIERLDEFLENAPTEKERKSAKARLDKLKDRRAELRKNYVQARFDSLKADVQAEYNKLVLWAKKTVSTSPETKFDRAVDNAADRAKETTAKAAEAARDAKARTMAVANPASAATSADLANYKTNPSDENKADVKASLALLDAEIKRLDERCDHLPRGRERDATKLRIKALKERRGELAGDFRKARFDALMADVKAEWNKFVN